MNDFKKHFFSVVALILLCHRAVIGDVESIRISGDSTLMGMKIESSYFNDGAFLIETTGARFEYVKGKLKIYQGLEARSRRLLSTIGFDNEPNFVKVESNNDHILFRSNSIDMGIYGDSTCIISPKTNQELSCKGNFKPDYEGRFKGELLLIDDKGGMEIYPQRYESGYEIKSIELGKPDWLADYKLNAGERVMIAAFPGREFDWEKSFRINCVGTGGKATVELYGLGIMPFDSTIKRFSKNFDIIIPVHQSLYKGGGPGGEYVLNNESEFLRLIKTSHQYNMKVVPYTSLFYYYRKFKSVEKYFTEVDRLIEKYGIDGVYVDGLLFDQEPFFIDDKITNYETVRKLRQRFGANGVIVYHGTSLGTPVSTIPNVDTYCDATLYGEGVPFKSVNVSYVRYQVRKYNISNTVGIWLTDQKPSDITPEEIADAIINMNCRDMWGDATFHGKFDNRYLRYLVRLKQLKLDYYKKLRESSQK